jgi:hypothetical protein
MEPAVVDRIDSEDNVRKVELERLFVKTQAAEELWAMEVEVANLFEMTSCKATEGVVEN